MIERDRIKGGNVKEDSVSHLLWAEGAAPSVGCKAEWHCLCSACILPSSNGVCPLTPASRALQKHCEIKRIYVNTQQINQSQFIFRKIIKKKTTFKINK